MITLNKDWKAGKEFSILILRLVAGFVLLYGHGFGKLSTIFTGQEIKFFDPIGIGANPSFYLAAFAEGICAILLMLGLFTRYAAIVLAINFLVIFKVHFKDGYEALELISLYLFTYIAIVFAGGGKYSLDNLLFNKKR
ncbi:MAG: DoxX family protein [Chitinophagales bacterium]|nr:DoxX family protein [Chitinophagales bacterium]